MKNKLMASVLAAGMLISISACGSSSSQGKVKLDMLTGLASGTVQLTKLNNVVKEFEQKNPNITINLENGTDNLEQNIKIRLAGHNPPDIWDTHGWSRDRYGSFLEPLQNRSWAKKMKPISDSVFKTSNGEFYALPWDVQITGIVYNATVLEKAGVDPKSINSWDDFTKACRKIKDMDYVPIGAGSKETATLGNIPDYMLSGMYTKSEKQELKNGKFDTSVYAKTTDIIDQWSKEGFFNPDFSSAQSTDIMKMMAQDKLAFFFWGNTAAYQIQSYNPNVKLGVMPLPSSDGTKYFSSGEDLAYGVSKTSKNKDAALKFIDFMAKPSNMNQLTKTTNNDAALTGIQSDMGGVKETYNYWVNEKKVQTYPYFDRAWLPNGMWDTMCKTTDGLLTGQVSSQSAADQMKTQFQSLYSQKS